MKPSSKSPAMTDMLEKLFGRSTSIERSVCVFCSEPVTESSFRDERSRKEYTISGLCQKCQDEVF